MDVCIFESPNEEPGRPVILWRRVLLAALIHLGHCKTLEEVCVSPAGNVINVNWNERSKIGKILNSLWKKWIDLAWKMISHWQHIGRLIWFLCKYIFFTHGACNGDFLNHFYDYICGFSQSVGNYNSFVMIFFKKSIFSPNHYGYLKAFQPAGFFWLTAFRIDSMTPCFVVSRPKPCCCRSGVSLTCWRTRPERTRHNAARMFSFGCDIVGSTFQGNEIILWIVEFQKRYA